ncbi:hypothetical protein Y058_06670 [Vibrio mimicus]|nr:hypothetical protein Y058_06670 [Vibrio mimicus]
MFKVRLLLVSYLTDLPVMAYYQRVVVPVLSVLVISSLSSILLLKNLPRNLGSSLLVIVFSISVSILAMYFLGLDKYWREKVVGVLTSKFLKSREVR